LEEDGVGELLLLVSFLQEVHHGLSVLGQMLLPIGTPAVWRPPTNFGVALHLHFLLLLCLLASGYFFTSSLTATLSLISCRQNV
jgi:hypothetical protein